MLLIAKKKKLRFLEVEANVERRSFICHGLDTGGGFVWRSVDRQHACK